MDKIYDSIPQELDNKKFHYDEDKTNDFSNKKLRPLFEEIMQIIAEFTETKLEDQKTYAYEQWSLMNDELG